MKFISYIVASITITTCFGLSSAHNNFHSCVLTNTPPLISRPGNRLRLSKFYMLFSVCPHKYQGSNALTYATTASLPIISNTLFTLIVIFDSVLVDLLTKSLNKP